MVQGSAGEAPLISLTRSEKRRRLELPVAQGPPLLLSYRVLGSHGRLHLVVFIDPQPPFLLTNATGMALEARLDLCGTLPLSSTSAFCVALYHCRVLSVHYHCPLSIVKELCGTLPLSSVMCPLPLSTVKCQGFVWHSTTVQYKRFLPL
jgi:hypothetical protein